MFDKTEVLHKSSPAQHRRSMVRHLTSLPPLYIGSTIANDCSVEKELSARIQSASAAFGRLRERLWNKHIKLVTKMTNDCLVFCTVQRRTRCIDVLFSDCHRYSYPTPLARHPWNQVVRPGDKQRSTATCRYAKHRGNASKPATYLDRPRCTNE